MATQRDPSRLPVQVNLRLPLNIVEFLDNISRTQDVSRNQLIVNAINEKYDPDPTRRTRQDGAVQS